MENNAEKAVHDGVVVSVDGDAATIRFVRSSMCAHCGACMTAADNTMELTLPNTLQANVGDRVQVMLSARQVVKASLIAYLIPLALLLLGIWIGSQFSEAAALICGLSGCAVAFLILRLIDRRLRGRGEFRPVMTAITNEDENTKIENSSLQTDGQ